MYGYLTTKKWNILYGEVFFNIYWKIPHCQQFVIVQEKQYKVFFVPLKYCHACIRVHTSIEAVSLTNCLMLVGLRENCGALKWNERCPVTSASNNLKKTAKSSSYING